MELAQWVLPLDTGGFDAAVTPADRNRLELEGGEVWTAGPTLHTEDLPLPVRLGLPKGGRQEVVARAALLRFRPVSEAGDPFVPDDPLAAVALLTELFVALGAVIEALRLPLSHIVPTPAGEVEIAISPIVGKGDAPLAESVLLLGAAAEILSRARGLSMLDARVQFDDQPWRGVDARLLRALQPH